MLIKVQHGEIVWTNIQFVLLDFFATIQLELVFLIIGLWGVLTSAFGYCPFNGLMGRNTCAIRYNEATSEEIAVETA